MSLAMYAAPFNDDINTVSNNGENENAISKKRNSQNRTQKRRYSQDTKSENNNMDSKQRIAGVLQTMQNLPESDGDMGDFSPIPPPQSAGVQATISRDTEKQGNRNGNMDQSIQNNIQSNTSIEGYTQMNSDPPVYENEEFYSRYIPNYEEMYKNQNVPYDSPSHPTYNIHNKNSQYNKNPPQSPNEALLAKLNYMIHLLEEQQDEKTGSVTEEVILYSFLGIFIIFLVDTFTRVSKYTR
jgi:hypothetical protein